MIAIPLLGIKCSLPFSPTRTGYVLIKLLLLTASSVSANDLPLRSGWVCVLEEGRRVGVSRCTKTGKRSYESCDDPGSR